MPLDGVLRADRNPKRHDAALIRKSIGKFGVVETPALDERTGKLVAGHGRLNEWERARAAGENPPDGVQVVDGDWHVPISRGWASRDDAEADAYLLVSNRSTELGGWDGPELAGLLTDVTSDGLLDYTGFTEDDLATLLGGNDDEDDPIADTDSDPGDYPSYGVAIVCHTLQEQADTYEALTEQGYRCQLANSSSSATPDTTANTPRRARAAAGRGRKASR